MEKIQSVLIVGDGIGEEIIKAALVVLSSFQHIEFCWYEQPAGLNSLEKYGELVPKNTLNEIEKYGSALKGPFTTPFGGTQRSPNWIIRRNLDLYACVRPIISLKDDIDILLIRENTEDVYAAIEWETTPDVCHALKIATYQGCKRIANYAFRQAQMMERKTVTVVHKANNLKKTEGLFLSTAYEISNNFPFINIENQLVDSTAADMIITPKKFDVILTSNTYGDILSSVGSGILGSNALVPSASVNDDLIIVEASHGSAPNLAGKQVANPIGIILASSMLLDNKGYGQEANIVRQAIEYIRNENITTPDLGGTASTIEVAQEIKKYIKRVEVL